MILFDRYLAARGRSLSQAAEKEWGLVCLNVSMKTEFGHRLFNSNLRRTKKEAEVLATIDWNLTVRLPDEFVEYMLDASFLCLERDDETARHDQLRTLSLKFSEQALLDFRIYLVASPEAVGAACVLAALHKLGAAQGAPECFSELLLTLGMPKWDGGAGSYDPQQLATIFPNIFEIHVDQSLAHESIAQIATILSKSSFGVMSTPPGADIGTGSSPTFHSPLPPPPTELSFVQSSPAPKRLKSGVGQQQRVIEAADNNIVVNNRITHCFGSSGDLWQRTLGEAVPGAPAPLAVEAPAPSHWADCMSDEGFDEGFDEGLDEGLDDCGEFDHDGEGDAWDEDKEDAWDDEDSIVNLPSPSTWPCLATFVDKLVTDKEADPVEGLNDVERLAYFECG